MKIRGLNKITLSRTSRKFYGFRINFSSVFDPFGIIYRRFFGIDVCDDFCIEFLTVLDSKMEPKWVPKPAFFKA